MKNIKIWVCLLGFFLSGGCSEISDYNGKYTGILDMEDGTHEVGMVLFKSGKATLSGFHETDVEGEWEAEKVGDAKIEGAWATFEFPNYRMRYELSMEKEGLRVERISLRMKGKTVLRTLELQKAKPLLVRQ